jgi:hypothetical protein
MRIAAIVPFTVIRHEVIPGTNEGEFALNRSYAEGCEGYCRLKPFRRFERSARTEAVGRGRGNDVEPDAARDAEFDVPDLPQFAAANRHKQRRVSA